MKILYGIQLTGNGHLSRSIKMINRLEKSGFSIDILVSGRNSNLNLPFISKYDLRGFTFYYNKKGELDFSKTWKDLNFLQFLKDIRLNLREYDFIITDFEPVTAWAYKISGKLSIGISNQVSFLSKKLPRPENKSFLNEFILKYFAPVDIPIGLSFCEWDDFIYTPIISENIIKMKKKDEGFYLVYLPNFNIKDIFNNLNRIKANFRIFHDVKYTQHTSSINIYPLDKFIFHWNLVNCHGVITSAGFQTPSEALYLGKKLMVMPIKDQYEQECNAVSLEKLGIRVGDFNNVKDFVNFDAPIKLDWEDSTDKIIKNIKNIVN